MNKQHILNEIRRTATENGGSPLGMNRFEKATGIKREDCVGKFWVRWSDAVREAGLVPNERQTAYSEDTMIQKIIVLARELGHLPLKAEMQLAARRDASFPNYQTFNSRFGPRSNRTKAILDYCKRNSGHDDIEQYCLAAPPEREAPESDAAPVGIAGYVYLGRSGRHYKIGRSVAPGQRERQLAIQLPEKFVELHRIATDDPVGIEAYWHNRFKEKRKNGEFFELSAADVSAFKRRGFM